METLLPLFRPAPQGSEGDIADFCAFVAEQRADLADPDRHSTKQVQFDDFTLRLGSIHSVKGKSVDGILVLESEIWKGNSVAEQCIDLGAVLPHAFGVTDELFTGVLATMRLPTVEPTGFSLSAENRIARADADEPYQYALFRDGLALLQEPFRGYPRDLVVWSPDKGIVPD